MLWRSYPPPCLEHEGSVRMSRPQALFFKPVAWFLIVFRDPPPFLASPRCPATAPHPTRATSVFERQSHTNAAFWLPGPLPNSCWSHLGAPWAPSGGPRGVLGAPWGIWAPFWVNFGSILAPFWVHVGSIFARKGTVAGSA